MTLIALHGRCWLFSLRIGVYRLGMGHRHGAHISDWDVSLLFLWLYFSHTQENKDGC